MWLKILIWSYVILVILDSAITYTAIKHLGFVETWRSQVVLDYYGLTPGIIVSTVFCLCLAWLLWRIRTHFKVATYLGLSALALIELAAVVNNAIQISSS